MWPWFFSGLNETPPSSSAGRTPPPGWRGALGDLPGFRREGRGGGRPGGRGPCPHPLAPGASVVPVRPPSRRRPCQPPAGLAGWRFAGRLLLTKHHFPPARGHDASGAPALTVAVETPGAFRSPSDSLNRDSAPPVFPVSRGFPVTTPGEGLLLSCPVLSGPFC